MDSRYDIVVVGAGIAGASLAAAIGARARVLILEAEEHPGYHTTGRSAAFWSETYGGPMVQPLTSASGAALRDLGVLAPRTALTLGRAGEEGRVAAFVEQFGQLGMEIARLDRQEIQALVPGLLPGWTCGAFEPTCCDIDVARLHQHYLVQARRAGAALLCKAALTAAERTAGGWRLNLSDGRRLEATILANAAGAWADAVALLADVPPLGITPYRRTMAQISVNHPVSSALPLVLDIAETFYFKPESGGLWLSPHDETPSPACDVVADELDVAVAIDRFEQVMDWRVRRVERRWAGLRSFAPDRLPVYGFAPRNPAFFWFAGQGGFGIQTAPAAAAIGANLILGEQSGGPVDPGPYAPNRF